MGRASSMHGSDNILYKILFGKPERRRTLEDLGVDGRMLLK
jgi:hypothetical protein